MPDAKLVADGCKVAWTIESAIQSQGAAAANRVREALSAEDVRALAAYREHQLGTLVAQVEDTPEGAEIRWKAALRAYDAYVTKMLTASIEGSN